MNLLFYGNMLYLTPCGDFQPFCQLLAVNGFGANYAIPDCYPQNNAYHVTIVDNESLSAVDSSMAGAVSNTRMAVMANFFKFNQAPIASILFRFFIRFFY